MKAMSFRQWLAFLMYFPFGCFIAVGRFVLVFFLALIVPETRRYGVFRWVGGLVCKAEGSLELPKAGALILSNHSNYLDPIVVGAGWTSERHVGTVIWQGVNVFSRVICRPTVSVLDNGKNGDFLTALNQAAQTHNIVVFPEGAVTDNTAGLLRFQRSVFRLEQPIYLMAIRYRRAFPFLQGKAMSRQMGFEVLVDLFQPWTFVDLIPLGKLPRQKYATAQAQADAAQKCVADALGVKASRWTKHDRHKRLFRT